MYVDRRLYWGINRHHRVAVYLQRSARAGVELPGREGDGVVGRQRGRGRLLNNFVNNNVFMRLYYG